MGDLLVDARHWRVREWLKTKSRQSLMQSSSSQVFAVVMATIPKMYIKSGNWKEIQDKSQDTKDKVKTEKRRTIRKKENVTFPCTHSWQFSLYLQSSRPNSPITKPKLYTINWYFSSYLPFICFVMTFSKIWISLIRFLILQT